MSSETGMFFDERGLITRIYMENFVTYDKAEIRPGRNLNLIIGPNGTGKSTMVCAIVLGLHGKPSLIGRATSVKDYIKEGCHNAKIEIELKDTNNKRVVIVRSFNTSNQTTWMLNGKPVQGKEIQNMTKSMNIQIDNLCQFLPQDKVQAFSDMNSQQLLENTERSAGDPKMVEYHDKLKEYGTHGKKLEDSIANKTRLLESETQKYEGMKETVGNIKEKRKITKKIKALKQKRAWISYDQSRKQLCEAKIGRDKAAAEMKKLDEQLRPIKETISQLESHIKVLKKTVLKHDSELSNKMSKVERSLEEIQNMAREVREIEKNREHKIQSEENRDQEIMAVVQQKNKLDNDLKVLVDDVGTEQVLIEMQQKINPEMEQQRRSSEKLMNEINVVKGREEHISDQIRTIAAEMQAAKDVEAKRLELLRVRSSDAYQGVMWLRQNVDKFAGKIHEPMLLTIQVTDAYFSKYLETILSLRDLVAFVCEEKSDMNLLMEYLRDEKKLKINVIYSDANRQVRRNPNIPMETLRQYGFQHYLLDLIKAPETIMKYLIAMYNLQNIPLGTKTVEDNIDNIPNLRTFFSQNNIYAVSISKYSGAKSTRSSRVTGTGALSIILDTGKLHGLTEKSEKLNVSRTQVLEAIKELETKWKASNDKLDKLRLKKQEFQRNVQTMLSLKTRINLAERKIRSLENERTSIDDIKAAAASEIQVVLKKQLKMYAQYNAQLSDCFKFISTNQQTKFELQSHQRIFGIKTSESQDLRDKCSLAEQTYRRLESELMPLRTETQRLYEVAMESTKRFSPADKEFKPFHTTFAKLPYTIEEIEVELETAQAQAYCLGENADADHILRNFESAEANVKKLTEEIEEKKVEASTIAQKIEETKLLWLTPLQELVARINQNFSTYFGLMGCAGEVTLKPGDNPDDFDQYGLKIRVKFRDADELQELTRQRQSGGERAVTTAVYMIALQELSRVPFRCVDEINQGMDAINERRVFELIVQITGKANSSQYFLLTPKLLPNLVYSDNATVHCVFNGAFMLSYTEFDTISYCKKKAKKSRQLSKSR